jgi:UPF0271 protein
MTGPVDLDSDLGQSFGHWTLGEDETMLALVTSANVARGLHTGDPATLLRTCTRTAERGVVVGARLGSRDLAGALDAMCGVAGPVVRYLKPPFVP